MSLLIQSGTRQFIYWRRLLQNSVQQRQFVQGHFLDFKYSLGGLAFNEVGGERVRAAPATPDGRFRLTCLRNSWRPHLDKDCRGLLDP
jgi:hypothetical protein